MGSAAKRSLLSGNMSRLGKKPIAVPTGVTVTVTDGTVAVKGPKGTLSRSFKRDISFSLEGDTVVLTPERETVATRALWGTYASHLKNMVEGVTQGYEKKNTIKKKAQQGGGGLRGGQKGEGCFFSGLLFPPWGCFFVGFFFT